MTDRLSSLRESLASLCREQLDEQLTGRLVALARPAIRLRSSREATGLYLGGAPRLEPNTPWPRSNQDALQFLCSFDTAELASFVSDAELPANVVLNFFYDCENQPWGLSADEHEGWRVLLANRESAVERGPPEGVRLFPQRYLTASQTLTLPGWEEGDVEFAFPPHSDTREGSELRRQRYFRLLDAWAELEPDAVPSHRLGGWPNLIQAPIWMDCEAAAPQGPSALTSDWRLLLQLDTDDELGWMWGSVGQLYFAVRRSVSDAQRFADAWLVLQCT